MTAIPIHTPIRTPASSAAPSHAGPATPHQPGSPQATPGDPNHQQHPQQDSLEDIRSGLDHHPGGLSEPDPTDQQALVDAVPHNEDGAPERFPDPFGSWSQLQNDGGNAVPGRSNNCADCSRSFLETWYGNPQVSAPRTLDTDEHGNPDVWSPENNANDNQIRWTGAAHTYAGPGNNPDTANNIASTLQQAGPGSAAIVQVNWVGGGGHAFNVVNHNGNIIWVDTQSGQVSHAPLHIDNAAHVWHIPLDANRNPIDTTQPHAEDSESQNTESQNHNDDESRPENSENDGQPENSQNPQNDASGDTPKQGDDTDTGTNSLKSADPTTPDASNNEPPTADPNTTNGEPENENRRPQSESKNPSEPDSTPDSRGPSQDIPESRQPSADDGNADPQQQPQRSPSPETPSEHNRPSPAETPSTPDQQSGPNEATRPDEQGRTPDKAERPTATTESRTRPDSPSEHRQPPAHTTPDNADNGTPDKSTRPTQTATDTPNDATTNRDTPQQTNTPSDPRTSIPHQQTTDPRATGPRTADPRTTDPHTSDARASDPRTSDPRTSDPRTSDPRREETPDRTRTSAPRREETPDRTRTDDPNQSPADDHHDRPSDTNKDSAVPRRESLPNGKNADAADYIKNSTRGKDPLYGPIADNSTTSTDRPDSDGITPPHGPAEPAARNNEDDKAFIHRMVDFANEGRKNRELYWRKDGQRKSLDNKVDGRELPQLKRDPDYPDDEDKFIAASDVPPPVQPDYMPEETHPPVDLGRDEGRITPENLADLDAETNDREWTLQADRIAEATKHKAEEDHGEDSEEHKAAKRVYSDTHSAVRDIGESHGEHAALYHAMASQHPEYVLVDVPRTGNGSDQFDQIYEHPNNPGHYIVVEAKAPTGQLGSRTGHTGQKVMQGTREYFETIHMLMQEGTPEQKAIADKLEAAYELGNVQYVLVQSKVETDPEANEAVNNGNTDGGYVGDEGPRERKRYGGFTMEHFDIRPEDRQE